MKLVWGLLLLLFIALGAFSSLMISSLFSLTKAQLDRFYQLKDVRARRIAKLMNRPFDVLVTLLFLDVVGGVLSQNAASNLVSDYGDSFALKVGLPWLLWVVFAELFPKIIGMQHNSAVALFAGRFLEYSDRAFGTPRKFIVSATQIIARTLFGFLGESKRISTRELVSAITTEKEVDILNKDEKNLITGILALGESNLRQIMTPRADIITFDLNRPLIHLKRKFEQVDAIPIVWGSLDHIVGILFSRDFSRVDPTTLDELKAILKKPQFIPETLNVSRRLLHQLQASDGQLQIVVDEYGVVTGLITLDNLLERLFRAPQEVRSGKRRYWQMDDRALIASGQWELDEMEAMFGYMVADRKNRVTVGGWLSDVFGEIPKAGSKRQIGDLLFSVLAAEPNRIRRIYIRRS